MKIEEVGPEFLEWLKGAGEKSAEFVEREAPLLAQEIVAWHFWSSVFLACVFLLLATVGGSLATWMLRCGIKENNRGRDGGGYIIGFIFLGLASLAAVGAAADNGYQAVKASCAPRLVIIENLKGLVK